MAPNPITCSKDGCDFTTPPNIPNWELIIKALELHVQACHATPNHTGPVSKEKLEKYPRPTFSLGMSEGDWSYAEINWNSYIGQTPVSPQEQLLQLRAACEDDLLRRIYESGDFMNINTVELLLARMKLLAVKQIHKTRHMMNMWEMCLK